MTDIGGGSSSRERGFAIRLRQTFLWIMIVSLALAAALGVVAIVFGSWGSTSEKILITSLLVGAFSLTALGAAIVLDQRRRRVISWIGIVTSILALAIWTFVTWFEPWRWQSSYDIEELIMKVGSTFTIVCIWCPHVGLLSLLRLDRTAFRGVRKATWVLVTLLGALLMFIFWTESYEEWVGRTMGVLSILSACGTIVTPVLGIVERVTRRESAETIERRVFVELTCPRCGSAQRIRAGGDKCSDCRLRITIDVEEPRCECGYQLYQLEGDTCPECGRAIGEADRWTAPKRG